jgi:response regulator RpfG family c-di-GMP phosphodiesterase
MTRGSRQNIAYQFPSIKPADGRHMPAYITKPFNKAEVCTRVRNQVQLYQMTQALRTAQKQLCDKQQRLDEDLCSAAIIQQSLILKHTPYLPYVPARRSYAIYGRA